MTPNSFNSRRPASPPRFVDVNCKLTKPLSLRATAWFATEPMIATAIATPARLAARPGNTRNRSVCAGEPSSFRTVGLDRIQSRQLRDVVSLGGC